MSEENNETVEQKPNVVFVGRKLKVNSEGVEELVKKQVPDSVNLPRLTIILPEGLKHSQGFYSEHAAKLIQSSDDFKEYTPNVQPETDLPTDFPLREVLRGLYIGLADVKLLDRDGLVALNGIGEKSADKILEYLQKEVTDNNG